MPDISLDVLVVDDEPKICHILGQILKEYGCSVRIAHDGLEALDIFSQKHADVVITDIRMPKLAGIELLRELKHIDPLLSVIVVTAYASVEGAVEAMQQGACDFITKPFDTTQIQAILYRCQQRISLTRQLQHTSKGLLKLEELNRRLVELNDMKSQFLAVISHEINTPLCLMSEWLYLLCDKTLGELSTEQQHAVDILINAYERLHRLLQQLIDLMQGANIILQLKELPVQELIQQALTRVMPLAETRSIAIALHLPSSPVVVEVDRSRCIAAFEYLIDNAVKFNRDGGRVDVTVTATDEKVKIEICDTGIGIPEEDQQRVFEPFFQVDRRLNRAYAGSGIGLPLAKRYFELHGGSIHLSSRTAMGTTVCVSLVRPMASSTASAKAEGSMPNIPS